MKFREINLRAPSYVLKSARVFATTHTLETRDGFVVATPRDKTGPTLVYPFSHLTECVELDETVPVPAPIGPPPPTESPPITGEQPASDPAPLPEPPPTAEQTAQPTTIQAQPAQYRSKHGKNRR
jgi:hypothetical protein